MGSPASLTAPSPSSPHPPSNPMSAGPVGHHPALFSLRLVTMDHVLADPIDGMDDVDYRSGIRVPIVSFEEERTGLQIFYSASPASRGGPAHLPHTLCRRGVGGVMGRDPFAKRGSLWRNASGREEIVEGRGEDPSVTVHETSLPPPQLTPWPRPRLSRLLLLRAL